MVVQTEECFCEGNKSYSLWGNVSNDDHSNPSSHQALHNTFWQAKVEFSEQSIIEQNRSKHLCIQSILSGRMFWYKCVLGSLLLALIHMNATQRFGLGEQNWVQFLSKKFSQLPHMQQNAIKTIKLIGSRLKTHTHKNRVCLVQEGDVRTERSVRRKSASPHNHTKQSRNQITQQMQPIHHIKCKFVQEPSFFSILSPHSLDFSTIFKI